ncbi:transposon tf2-9 polyprotein [Plakobranchus ocellatus]|uniref:Transposon tf2-9 polyprotein n=1 Tax=Plakobranchus ocellatus TaxID=259542 RepID=A0AAV3Y1P0_9GAST|nr:transposon tf2-9 polyprotein [Plakobranchus ocellatus]
MSRAQSQEELIKLLKDQMSQQQQQMEALLAIVQQQNKTTVTNTKFGEFDPSVELWSDYWARFETFTKANAIPNDRRAEIFLTNQSSAIYKLVMNLAQQQTPPRDINSLSMVLAANRLARWALTLSQYDYQIEYRKTASHGNADALSRLPAGADPSFDREETGADSTTICTIKMISSQIVPTNPKALESATSKDKTLTDVIQCFQHRWPKNIPATTKPFYALRDSLSLADGCLFYGHRVVIPSALQPQVLQILHLGHFGMQRMKQLARTAVYWPRIDTDIEDIARHCAACNEHQRLPPKQPFHPWITPEKPWIRVHIDHAINFRGHNWLVMVDAFSKYPCIHLMTSITTKVTTRKLDGDFAHFGYPHAIVTDNATCFSSAEFQTWCEQRGIEHLHGAPYHPETNGTAERLVQTFKQSLKKSTLPPADALQEFLMHYRRTPLASGSSPSELLNGRQIRTAIDIIVLAQISRQPRDVTTSCSSLSKDSPCFALAYKGGRKDRWRPAVVTAVLGHKLCSMFGSCQTDQSGDDMPTSYGSDTHGTSISDIWTLLHEHYYVF